MMIILTPHFFHHEDGGKFSSIDTIPSQLINKACCFTEFSIVAESIDFTDIS